MPCIFDDYLAQEPRLIPQPKVHFPKDKPHLRLQQVYHYLELLRDVIGYDKIKEKVVNPLTGKKIGAYYGCLLLRPGKILGFDNPEKYLEKFINFEIKLDNGSISELITEKYADYIALFNKDIFQFVDSVEECLKAIFKDIDIRTQEQLVKKSMLVHKLLYDEPKDYSFMCMELLIAVMIYVYHDTPNFNDRPINASSFDTIFKLYPSNQSPAFTSFFKEQFENIPFRYKVK